MNADFEISVYNPPEINDFIIKSKSWTKNQKAHESKILYEKLKIHSLDMWSLGMLLIEIINGYPIEIKNKGKIITASGKSIMKQNDIFHSNPKLILKK